MGETIFTYYVTSSRDLKIHFLNLGIAGDFRHKHNVYNLYFSPQMFVPKIYIPTIFLA